MDDNITQIPNLKFSTKEEKAKTVNESNPLLSSNLNFYSDNFFSDDNLLNQIMEMNINNFFVNSNDEKNFEKISLNSFSKKNEKQVKQLTEYLSKGSGEVFYEIFGLFENSEKTGIPEVLLREYIEELRKTANSQKAKMKILKIYQAKNGFIAEIFIRKNAEKIYMDDENEINIGIYGEESCGKTTLLSVMIYGCLDNGNARKRILSTPQEIASGKTINISYQVMIIIIMTIINLNFCVILSFLIYLINN